jgi:hypothetical protein
VMTLERTLTTYDLAEVAETKDQRKDLAEKTRTTENNALKWFNCGLARANIK